MNKKWVIVGPLLALTLFAGACVNAPESTAPPAATGTTQTTAVGGPGPAGPASPLASSYMIPVSSQQTGLWVNGQGKVTFTPDIAVLTLGIESQEKTVALAQSNARDAMARVLAALKAKNVADKDIRTQTFSIQPVTQYIQSQQFPTPRPGKEVIIGYRVSNTVVVKIRKMDDAGPVIDAVSEAGGDLTRVNGISFTMDDFTTLQNQARDNAVKDALARAKQIAAGAGITLGKPVYINESGGFVPQTYAAKSFAMEAAGGGAPTPISPGEQQLTGSVQMVFAIQ